MVSGGFIAGVCRVVVAAAWVGAGLSREGWAWSGGGWPVRVRALRPAEGRAPGLQQCRPLRALAHPASNNQLRTGADKGNLTV